MQRDLTLMLLRRHELQAMIEAAQGVMRVARENSDEDAAARARRLIQDVRNELDCRQSDERSDLPF